MCKVHMSKVEWKMDMLFFKFNLSSGETCSEAFGDKQCILLAMSVDEELEARKY